MTKQEAELAVTKELDANERLLWAGVPKQGFLLRGSDAAMIPFSLLWCGFTFYWEALVLKTNGPLFIKFWGAMFMLIGLYIVFGRFFVDAWQRGVTAYALTDRRALIRSGLFSTSVESLPLRTLADVTLTARDDGSGTITFGQDTVPRQGFITFGRQNAVRPAPCFERIDDARSVYQQLRAAQSAEARPA
jgi:hypothetical protein